MWETWFTGIAVLISLVSFAMTFQLSRSTYRRDRMPVLVARTLPSDPRGPLRVEIRNVGRGPATNIILGVGERDESRGSAQLGKRLSEKWFSPMRLAPIAANEAVEVSHPERSYLWLLSYTDALGDGYTTKTSNFGTRVHEGRYHPKVWTPEIVEFSEAPHPQTPWLVTNDSGTGFI